MSRHAPYDGRPVQAVLRAGAIETHYSRAGSGPPILLLAGAHREGEVSTLFGVLAGAFKVISPHPPARVRSGDSVAFGSWLRDVIDGLGLWQPGMVANAAFEEAALEFAATDPERLGRLVICRPYGGAAGEQGVETNRLPTGHLLLIVRATETGDWDSTPGLAREVVRFLAG